MAKTLKKQQDLAHKLNSIAANVAKKAVFVVSPDNGCYDVINYFNKNTVIKQIPSKNLAKYICEAMNKTGRTVQVNKIQCLVNLYSKHYYDCEFYKHTIKTTDDELKRDAIISRLDLSIEHLRNAATNIRKSC
jgi:hypothetical protein